MSEVEFWQVFEQEAKIWASQYVGEANAECFMGKKLKVSSDPNASVNLAEMQKLLVENPQLRPLMDSVVPSTMSETEFWFRVTHSPFFFALQGDPTPEGADRTVVDEEPPAT